MCSCTIDQNDVNAKSVSCLSVPLYKFPNLTEENISHLEVLGSKITSVEADSLTGCQVHELTLSNNKLQHVMDRALSSMRNSLISLDLSYNKLDSVPFAAFKDLRNLQWINLQRNRINSVLGDWSHVRNTVANLFLGENDITELTSELDERLLKEFRGLRQFKSLVWLNLDGNKIAKIHKHTLPLSLQTLSVAHNLIENFPLEPILTLPRLQWLYLRGNHIETLPDHKFDGRLRLEKIDLSENDLRTLPRLPFNNSAYVRDLNLAFNDIAALMTETFLGLNCKRIILSYNRIETFDLNAFIGTEDTLEYLDLDHNRLQEIPLGISYLQSLKYLYLSSNAFSDVPDDAFANSCVTLKALSFNGNHLARIPRSSLENCTRISHFNIAYNEIYDIDAEDFATWAHNVETLILSNNHINSLKAEVFVHLPRLNELSLSFNPLMHIDPRAFDGLHALNSLELSFSLTREEFPSDIFKSLINLQYLSLDNNKFVTLPTHALDDLPSLKFLNLEFNELLTVPVNLFKSDVHKTLVDIRLNNNKIAKIQTGTFAHLNDLQVISLASNHIQSVQKGSFAHLPSLTNVVLANNAIYRISQYAFSNLPQLAKVNLEHNVLTDLNLNIFGNVSSVVSVNVSNNRVSHCVSGKQTLNMDLFDVSNNFLPRIPECLQNISLLRKLYVQRNNISAIEPNSFLHLTFLEELNLHRNRILNVHRHGFAGLQHLQILDLSHNAISQLHNHQFSTLIRLRVLNLRNNRLKYLYKDVLSNTLVEMLDLSFNFFSVVPSVSLAEVGNTLRHLSISWNAIEHVDSTTFPAIPFLQHLNLGKNKLTILPDNVFTSLGLLQRLDIGRNPLRANFKELFHYAQNLKELSLANIGITSVPSLPLPNLGFLNLSHNFIEVIDRNSLQNLKMLKYLDISHNRLVQVPSHLWTHIPYLKTLDISHNPIQEIISDSFYGLQNLQELNLVGLDELQKFDGKAIARIRILSTLSLQTWPGIANLSQQLCTMLLNLKQLRVLKLLVQDAVLSDQLACATNPKIRHIEVSGRRLRQIQPLAFAAFNRNPDLALKIVGTDVEDLPNGLFASFHRTAHLAIEVADNKLSHLSPEVLYVNYSSWKRVGATSIKGGLTIGETNFVCGCHLAWLGHWLRRWARESLRAHDAPIEAALHMGELLTQATCVDAVTGVRRPIVHLPPEDMSCQASALSNAQTQRRTSVIITLVLLFTFAVT